MSHVAVSEMLQLTIDHQVVSVPKGTTILEAAHQCGVEIPHLCFHPDQSIKGNCRICMVAVKGSRKLSAACATPVWEGMEVQTHTRQVRDMQKGVLELILANHHQDCLNCQRNGNCELLSLCERFNVTRSPLMDAVEALPLDNTNPSLIRESAKCVKCNRCVEACQKVQTVDVLTHSHRSVHFNVTPAYNQALESTLCVFCGQCSAVCPTGAIVEKDETEQVWEALEDPGRHVIVQVAPAVRVAIGDAFGMPPGAAVAGKLVTALKRLGFDGVFDTNFTADLTIVEESHELLHRLKNNGVLPLVTSCSPGWINFMEGRFSDLSAHISSCKSPQQMFGALSKTYYAELKGIDPASIYTVSIMPCTAKKYEAARPEMGREGYRDVDVVLTTRELARMIKGAGILFEEQKGQEFDAPFGLASGAGIIFGASGGVMEAALRTAHDVVLGRPMDNLAFTPVRGLEGVKEAAVTLGDVTLRVAAASGLSQARVLMEQIRNGDSPYHFIEIMACPGGCLGGGGQPIGTTKVVKTARMESLYALDEAADIRMSHQNAWVHKLYEEYLGEPNGHKAHELLHTHYKG